MEFIFPPGINSLVYRSCCLVHLRGKCTDHAVTTGRGMCMSHGQLSIFPPGLNSLVYRSCCLVHLRGKCTGHAVTTGRGMCMSHGQLSIFPPGLNSLDRSCCVSSFEGKVYGPCSNDWPGNVHVSYLSSHPVSTHCGMAGRNLLLCRTFIFFNKKFPW